MNRGTVADRVRIAIARLQQRGAPINLLSICQEDWRNGGRLAHTSILRNETAKALYLAHRSTKCRPRLRLRGRCREATSAEVEQIRRYLLRSRFDLAVALLASEAEKRVLMTELAAYRAMVRRGALVVPRAPVDLDAEIARYHELLCRWREFMLGYQPRLLKALEGGGNAS